jgi:hypothetical protein
MAEEERKRNEIVQRERESEREIIDTHQPYYIHPSSAIVMEESKKKPKAHRK